MVTFFGKRVRLFRPGSIWIRKVVQWAFFVLMALIAVNHSLGITVKDFCSANGLSFETIKAALQAEVDRLE